MGTTSVAAIDEALQTRDQLLALMCKNLHKAQNCMKKYADLNISEREFKVGDLVYLRLQPYRQLSMKQRHKMKLSPHYYGPFSITERIGAIAYRLDLPPTSMIHPVFHVSQLKQHLDCHVDPLPQLPPVDGTSVIRPELDVILARCMVKLADRAVSELLVKWHGQAADNATWERYAQLFHDFPHLVGKVF